MLNTVIYVNFQKSRKNVFIAYGNSNSDIMFIGDEPSNSEDEMGIFYTGKSGELLSKMIENVLNVKRRCLFNYFG